MRVFVSYRRADTQAIAGRIADYLRDVPGVDRVFIDVDGIAPGERFADRLRKAISKSATCLIVIGANWRGDPDRIADPGDFVRLEVAEALQGGKRVIPVLVEGASMPTASDLPSDLSELPSRHAYLVRHASFERDMEGLVDAMFGQRIVKRSAPIRTFARKRPLLWGLVRSLLGGASAVVALLGAGVVTQAITGRGLYQFVPDPGQMIFVLAGVVAFGAVAPLLFSHRR